MRLTQKAVTDAVGFALVGLEPMSVGKRVFLLAIVTIPTVMRRMTTSSPTVQKAVCGRKKSPAVAGRKTAACGGYCTNSVWGSFVPRGEREVRSIYIIRWGGAVVGNAVYVALHSFMLQGDGNDISGPLLMVRTIGNSVGVAIS